MELISYQKDTDVVAIKNFAFKGSPLSEYVCMVNSTIVARSPNYEVIREIFMNVVSMNNVETKIETWNEQYDQSLTGVVH